MVDLTPLGPAAVAPEELAGMVATSMGHDDVVVQDCDVHPVAYDIPSITTTGRHWVSGTALTPMGRTRPFRLFVKQVQAWRHSPFFAGVPEAMREFAARSVPWQIEGRVYRSDLATRLPDGLTMPQALGVYDYEPEANSIWLQSVENVERPWSLERYERAGYLLGRMAASRAVATLAGVGRFAWSPMFYVHGRLATQVIPALESGEVWRHPDVAEHFTAPLRHRLRMAAERAEDLCAELERMPQVTSHGDACPNNLMPGTADEEFVLIDFGFWMPQSVGFDLGQLVAGNIQLGLSPPTTIEDLDDRCVTAYCQGLHDEGLAMTRQEVMRSHALQLLLFAGLSALPFEMLTGTPAERLGRVVAARADLARFSLDLIDITAG